MTALERIARKLAEALRPPPEMKLWEYADAFRIVPSEASSEPGRWCTDRTPYLREIMECLSDSDPTRKVVLMKGAQLGATEEMLPAIADATFILDGGYKKLDRGEVLEILRESLGAGT